MIQKYLHFTEALVISLLLIRRVGILNVVIIVTGDIIISLEIIVRFRNSYVSDYINYHVTIYLTQLR